ncbi:MAG: hypothetical protein QOK52_02220 [Nitrososphaeraceae archaeon]|nr:hypothetical protein [Nitrososphaeraceae archaeon]
MASTTSRYKKQLSLLLDNRVITEELYRHFVNRGLKVISPSNDYGLEYLSKILPEIVIGASSGYVSKMKVPYQATSYVTARTKESGKGVYIYKIAHKPGGGVLSLTGGTRKLGDSIFASSHRILMGSKAMMISADNLVVNKEQIWNWQFFGDAVRELAPEIYEDLIKLREKIVTNSMFHQFVVARSDKTFRRLKLADLYLKNQIKILDPKNGISVIFLTNKSGHEYASKLIPESDLVDYVVTGKNFDMHSAMIQVRRLYDIDMILNDGGRIMSNSVRDLGILGEERVTLEPYPGDQFISSGESIEPESILGAQGIGIDGGEIQNGIRIHSTRIGDEAANVYLYPLNEELCMA